VEIRGAEFSSYTILDLQGKEVASGMADGTIDISGLYPGLYLFKVQAPDGRFGVRRLCKN